ncbi:MAG: ABC transporter ATP-binding protein [Rhodothermia bacterium]|nr:ABC transporter ATP-binding protein [Rhodothermia bacterium]
MISVRNLEKSYGRLKVLRDLSLDVTKGRVTAVLGPNAAGKTTLIKCILGLATPDSGAISVGGVNVAVDYRYRESIGYMPQKATFPENLTAREVIRFLQDLRSAGHDYDTTLLRDFEIESDLNKPLRSLSGGTRQKISASIAFLFNPRLLILDEPTAGLDPRSSSKFKDRILQFRSDGGTVILTSHIMSEVDELADQVVYLNAGRVAFEGKPREMRERTGTDRLERAIARLMEEVVK